MGHFGGVGLHAGSTGKYWTMLEDFRSISSASWQSAENVGGKMEAVVHGCTSIGSTQQTDVRVGLSRMHARGDEGASEWLRHIATDLGVALPRSLNLPSVKLIWPKVKRQLGQLTGRRRHGETKVIGEEGVDA